MKRLRLFHFDIKTYGNYGDTLLFEAVRQSFDGFADGACFEVADSRALRDAVSPSLVDYINSEFDAVIVGGGGLFLKDTNPNSRSGWQWNISLTQLERLQVPLIVYAVGNNRFIGQEDFSHPFREHLNMTLDKSVFFGLRGHTSVETIREYVDGDPSRVQFHPCPTTISSYLFPDLYRTSIPNRRVIAAESIVGKRQQRVGFDPDTIYRAQIEAYSRLSEEGWSVHSLPFARADMGFHDRLVSSGLVDHYDRLWGRREVLFEGLDTLSDLPIILGTRGHAQMVPFGMGVVPLSLHVHDKNREFATEIGHPEWAIDPRTDHVAESIYRLANEVHERQPEIRKELADVRAELFETTLTNLASIYRKLTGLRPDRGFEALSPRHRRVAARSYHADHERRRAEDRLRTATSGDATRDASTGRPSRSSARAFARAAYRRAPRRVRSAIRGTRSRVPWVG